MLAMINLGLCKLLYGLDEGERLKRVPFCRIDVFLFNDRHAVIVRHILSGCLLVVGFFSTFSHRSVRYVFGVESGFRLFAWLFGRAGGCFLVRLRECLVKGA